MQNKQWIWFFAIGLVVWYYLKKVEAAKALTVRYKLPQNIRIANGAIYWNQPVIITNPTVTPINLQNYNMQVQLEGYPIGTAYGAIFTQILAAQETTIFANVVIPLDALISAIPDLLKAGKTLDVRIVGAIRAEFITVPIDTLIRLPIPKLGI